MVKPSKVTFWIDEAVTPVRDVVGLIRVMHVVSVTLRIQFAQNPP
jgi:hypothetical protein